MTRNYLFLFLCFLFFPSVSDTHAQEINAAAIQKMIARYKVEPRGPYKDIRWFCKDGTIREARDPCPGIKQGHQRASYREEVVALSKKQHIFLGQILASTPNEDFWDESNAQSRLKQYQLEQYLYKIDNGWINQQAQYYRGAMQVEDESEWGIDFFHWLLSDGSQLQRHFYLIRQSAKDIPHETENNTTQLVRALSTEIAEAFPSFQNLRIKIHGAPDAGDSGKVWDFQDQHKAEIDEQLASKFDQLICGLEKMFRPFHVSDFDEYLNKIPKDGESAQALSYFTRIYPTMDCPPDQCRLISKTALILREDMIQSMSSTSRLALLDISNKMESLLNQEFSRWKIKYVYDILDQVSCLSEAATAFGFLELWEWDQIKNELGQSRVGERFTLQQLNQFAENGNKVTQWGTAMVRATYMPVIEVFREFEPLASGFYDDRVRSSVLLNLGNAVSRLGDEFSTRAKFSNDVMDIHNQSSIHGLNPGFTKGELVVVTGSPDQVAISADKIYVFSNPPSNLKPVAGIVTVSEGNTVSHIQLLARNLGIPNAVISRKNMDDLQKYNGQEVFYAVSNKGTVIIKPVQKMNDDERKLFEKKKRSEEKISVPLSKMQLYQASLLNLNSINASYSGKVSGPKAANLGQLKQMFPENVVNGIVLPFGVFRQHMNQSIPGLNTNYWAMMIGIFDHAECLRCSNVGEPEIEAYILHGLDSLSTLIKKMPLLPSFRNELEQKFREIFGQPLGKVPVFVRSDTNMEDLRDFTGAGLNLTVFNVVDPQKIFQAIKDVWASPYSERSYKWRQYYLNDPENVYPSIVIIPSVDGDHSGVMITKGLTSHDENDITVAFNYGVGGAVDGQAAESWLLKADGTNVLLSPAREPSYRTIPASGGSVIKNATFEKRILNPDHLLALREMAGKIKEQLPKVPGISSTGPWDIELGFKDDQIWLFQVRPFVENKQAASSEYLQKITPEFDKDKFLIL